MACVAGHIALAVRHNRGSGKHDVDVLLREECGIDVLQHPEHAARDALLRVVVEMALVRRDDVVTIIES